MNWSQVAVQCLMAATGGALGALGRFVVTGLVHRAVPQFLPLATLTVNVVGCFAIGVLLTWDARSGLLGPNGRIFLVTGILGGLTTFSTFGYETYALAKVGQPAAGLFNITANLLLGIGAVWLGAWLARWFGSVA